MKLRNSINVNTVSVGATPLLPISQALLGQSSSEPWSDGFPSLPGDVTRWKFGDLTNETMTAMDNPRIEDADGKGRFLSFKNFAWKGMSGVDGYAVDVNEWGANANQASFERNSTKVTATIKEDAALGLLFYNIKLPQSYVLKVTGMPEGCRAFFDDRAGNRLYIYEDGEYEMNPSEYSTESIWFSIDFLYPERWHGSKLTIEQRPLYPGALVFDGVDDFAECLNFPVMTKEKGYTVVALRQWITRGEKAQGLVSNVKNWLSDGAFLLEYRNKQAEHLNSAMSFGTFSADKDLPQAFTYQTSKSYNGAAITTGKFTGTDVLHVGKLATANVGTCANVAIWELVFLDHDATPEELAKIESYFIKNYSFLFN